jgi:hypothetical protein
MTTALAGWDETLDDELYELVGGLVDKRRRMKLHLQKGASIVPREANGEALRDDGIDRAISHAGHEWAARAYGYFIEYAARVGVHTEFQTEDVRQWAESIGFARPPDPRSWGAVAVRARRAGITKKVGNGPAKAARVHCGLVSIWRAK